MNGFTPFDEAGHMAQMEAGFAAFRAATARPEPEPEPEPEKKRLKVRITFTVEVDQEAYANYYGIDNTAKAVREFQGSQGFLKVTGVVNGDTFGALFLQ